jgi:hypothetical protein
MLTTLHSFVQDRHMRLLGSQVPPLLLPANRVRAWVSVHHARGILQDPALHALPRGS